VFIIVKTVTPSDPGSPGCFTPTLHFKIIGVIWVVLCLTGAGVFAPQLWSMATDKQYGISGGFYDVAFWVSQFFVEFFLLAGAMVGFGLFRIRRWAAICMRITATLLLLYCLSFVLMSHFPIAWLVVGMFGVAFAAYSLFVVSRFRPYEHAT
jgi:hypothetical protein